MTKYATKKQSNRLVNTTLVVSLIFCFLAVGAGVLHEAIKEITHLLYLNNILSLAIIVLLHNIYCIIRGEDEDDNS